MDFFLALSARIQEIDSPLCIGLDPVVPDGTLDPEMFIYEQNLKIIKACSEYAACFKPNLAFYEAKGDAGMRALNRSLSCIDSNIPVLIDAKRCDIGNTAEAYAKAIFSLSRADAVTLSPYMGKDAVMPFLAYKDKAVFLLARTSNPSAKALQDLKIEGTGKKLYQIVAEECLSWSKNIGLVVAGNDLNALQELRNAFPEAWFLSPGIGSQGGDITSAIQFGAEGKDYRILPVIARAISEAKDPKHAALEFVTKLREAKKAKDSKVSQLSNSQNTENDTLKLKVLSGLLDTDCFKTGEFTLKSGKKSPFYIDLRRVISDPKILDLVAQAYASIIKELKFDRIAGIPAAALPLATAVALKVQKPLIWPRMPLKEHGTGNRVEGAYKKGETVLLLDDLITTGLSKLEAIEILKSEGLLVKDLSVLIERGSQGRTDMEKQGINTHAFFHVSELFALCEQLGKITKEERVSMEKFAKSE